MVYFLSDAHLGSLVIADSANHHRKFISAIRQMSRDADAIYLLGDIFDFWSEFFYGRAGKPKGFDDILAALREAATRCPVHFFIGNHDIWTYGWLAEQTGMIVHKKPLITTIYGKRCYLAHGDGLGSTDRKYLFLRGLFHNPVAQFLFRLVPPALGNRLGYSWAEASRRGHSRTPNIYKGEDGEEQILFAKQHEQTQHVDYYIFGHRHLEYSLLLSTGAQVCVLGDFFEQFSYGAMAPNEPFSFHMFCPEENTKETAENLM